MWESKRIVLLESKEFGRVQKVNSVAKAENTGSEMALQRDQEIEPGKEWVNRDSDSYHEMLQMPNSFFFLIYFIEV